MYWFIIQFMVNFIETTLLYRYLEQSLIQKYSSKQKCMIVLLVTAISFLFTQFSFLVYLKFLLYFIIAIAVVISFNGNIGKKVVLWLGFLIVNIGIESIVVFGMMTINHISMEMIRDQSIYQLISIIMAKLILYLVVIINEKRYKRKNELILDAKSAMLIVTFFITIIGIMLSALTTYQDNEVYSSKITSIVFLAGFICFISIAVYNQIIKLTAENNRKNLMIHQQKLQKNYYYDINNAMLEIKKVKHDMSNHITCMQGYLNTKDMDGLQLYLNKISEPINNLNEMTILGQTVISSLIYAKKLEAEKHEIIFNSNIDAKLSINIDEFDACILIGNILDNAIEASKKVDKAQRIINLNIHVKEGWLLIDCDNSFDPKTLKKHGNSFISSKKDKVNHGMGLQNIQDIINKYEGDLTIKTVGNKFILHATLLNS